VASDTSRAKAPDNLPWPSPRLCVDTAEQRPWAFGYRPAPWQHEGERGPVHHGERDPDSLVTTMLGGPWESERANLQEGDYQLLGPDGEPIAGALCIERKSLADLRGSLSRGHDRLMAEMERMSPYTHPVLIVEAPIEVLLGDLSGAVRALVYAREVLADAAAELRTSARRREASNIVREAERWVGSFIGVEMRRHDEAERRREERGGRVTVQSLLGSTLSILADHRIPALFLPSRAWAEYAAAWLARRVWRRWLVDHPDGLAAERARLALAAIDAERNSDEPTPQPPSVARVSEAGGVPWSTAEAARRREAKRRTA
jgi:hypothetical protein